MPQLMTTKQVSDYLQMCKETVYELIKKGDLPAVKIGKQWRFKAEEIDAWLKEKQN